MKTYVLGLGPSLSNYTPDGNITVGVNDIWMKVPADFVVCVDQPKKFTSERILTIKKGKQKKFLTCSDEWRMFVANYEEIKLSKNGRGLKIEEDLFTEFYPYSNNSAFVACCFAIKEGAKEIILHGVDFSTHPALGSSSMLKQAVKHFALLKAVAEKHSIKIFVSSKTSALYPTLEW